MSLFTDGCYQCAPAEALIAKVLAGRCTMHYTRVAVGNGSIPEGSTPATMTEPAGYVMHSCGAGSRRRSRWRVSGHRADYQR